ncbi:MAG TPA: penicillin-binding protein 2 [Candidatus Binatus sp.]|nr:penicillin-binding protein 2 [Candidatus Binatus sp.]
MKEKERSRLRARAIFVFWVFFFVAALLVARLYRVQVHDGAALASIAVDQHRAEYPVSGQRGNIVDRFGVVFAGTSPAVQIFAQPPDVANPHATALALAPLLHRPAGALERDLTSHATFVYLDRMRPKALGDRIDSLGLLGIGTSDEPTGLRVDPQGRIGSTVVGFTGIDNQGLAGIEVAFNDVLAGKPGEVVEETDSQSRPLPFGRRVIQNAVTGDTVVLTIDRALQLAAEDVLAKTASEYSARSASAIVLRASTGEILALANWPNYDPNHYAAFSQDSYKDRAIADPYEPGSTFKLVTATAAIDSGRVSLEDTFPAENAIDIGGYVIHNADDGLMSSGHSRETLSDIVTYSHNVGAAEVAMRVGKRTMGDYIRRYGLDDVSGVDLPGESPGIIDPPDQWYGSRVATIAFGQGVSVTALSLARAYAAIANGGMLMRPLIVRELRDPQGRVIQRYEPQAVRRVMRPQTAAVLLTMLRNVVKRGTGTNAQIPGFAVAGKTGTAQIVENGHYELGEYVASFIGIVPADKPQYVVLINVERPRGAYYGGIVAAPAFRELARRVLWREGILSRRVESDVATDSSARNRTHAGAAREARPAVQGNTSPAQQ